MADYSSDIASANESIAEAGRSFTLKSQSGDPVYNLETGTYIVPTVEMTGTGVLLNYSAQEAGVYLQSGVLVTANTQKLLCGTAGITQAPKPSDTVEFDGVTFTVQKVKVTGPDGAPILYEIMVTR